MICARCAGSTKPARGCWRHASATGAAESADLGHQEVPIVRNALERALEELAELAAEVLSGARLVK